MILDYRHFTLAVQRLSKFKTSLARGQVLSAGSRIIMHEQEIFLNDYIIT